MFRINPIQISIMLISIALNFSVSGAAHRKIKISEPIKKEDHDPALEDNIFSVNFSTQDLEIGRNVEKLFSELMKNKLDLSLIDYFKKHDVGDRSSTFSNIYPIIDRLSNIAKLRNLEGEAFYHSCEITNLVVNPNAESLVDRLNFTIDKYCRNLFLKNLQKLNNSMNLSTKEIGYLKSASPFLAQGESDDELIKVLKNFKVNPVEHEIISNVLSEAYISSKVKPSPSVLKELKINNILSKFVQNNLHLDDVSVSFFQDEFNRLLKSAQESLDAGDFGKAKSNTMSAINFYNFNRIYMNDKKTWGSIIRIGKSFFYKGRDQESAEVLYSAKLIASPEDLNESLYYLLWPHVITKDFKKALGVIEKFSLEKSFDKFDSKLQFWIATTFIKNGDEKKGVALYNKIITNSPYSFYSIIALKELTKYEGIKTEEEILSKLISKDLPKNFNNTDLSDEMNNTLKRISIWNKVGNERFATLDIRFLISLSKFRVFKESKVAQEITVQAFKEFITTNLIKLLYSQKKYVTSFKFFQESLEQNSLGLNYKLLTLLFPLNYMELIKQKSPQVDPIFVISLIRQESAFNPEASSGVGAKGLMQLMPATAKRFNHRVSVKHLTNPEINVTLGTKYLKELIQRFDGNLIYTLASYNAGESRIDKWRREIFRNDDPLSTIESIPFEETRNYVKLIYRNNFFYSLLMKKSNLMVPLNQTFKVTLEDTNFSGTAIR